MQKNNIPTDNWIQRFYEWVMNVQMIITTKIISMMKKHTLLRLSAFTAFFLVILQVNAQFGRGPRIVSPEVNGTQTITFRLLAPEAGKVTVSGSWMSGWGTQVDMIKGDSGVWSVTTGVLDPDYYTYSFYVNGVKTLDPGNPQVVRDGSRFDNAVIVPGEASKVYTVQDVPHGILSKVWYPSPTLNKNRRMYVYTPPGYEKGNGKYPVFYLLHGAGGDEDAWTTLGRTPWIIDNLIAAGKAKPMIVVMTNGNAWAAAAPGEEPATGEPETPGFSQRTQGGFENSLVNDVIPYIEDHYRVLSNPENRAIAGLSMGGMHTQSITNTNPGMFDYIGVMSMGLMNDPRRGNYNEEEHKKQILTLKENGIKLYWIGCGKEDFLYEGAINLCKFYDDLGLKYEFRESSGGHTWANWRLYLSELAPRLFQ
jgi:enterochelin esterase-like enzyme